MIHILFTGHERAVQFCPGLCERMSRHRPGETNLYPRSADKHSIPLIIRIACMKMSGLFRRCDRRSVKLTNPVHVRTAKSVQSLQSSQSLWTHRGYRHIQVREISAGYLLNIRSLMKPAFNRCELQGSVESEGHSTVHPVQVIFPWPGTFFCTLDWRRAERLGATALFHTW